MSFFVTGTDTDVGKTYVSCLLIKALRASGVDAVGMKPICCGDRADSEALLAASTSTSLGAGGVDPDINDINPVWLRPPVAPYAASMIENRLIDVNLMKEKFADLSGAHPKVIVEGAGGWLVPIRSDYSMADFAAELKLPVLVVAANRLGVLNHTLLTVHAIQSAGLKCAGVILNHVSPPQELDQAVTTNRSILEHLLPVPILAEIPFDAEKWQGDLGFSITGIP